MPRPRPEPQDDADRNIFGHIDTVGWSVILIPEDDAGPGFAFSLGLLATHGHPDVILFGLKIEQMHGIVNGIGERVAGGERFTPGRFYEGVIDRFPVAFTPVDPANYREYLGYANWFYGGTDFPAVQCVYPDGTGRFPWDAGVNPRLAKQQPLIGPTPLFEEA